jgi:hypothetical protein
MAIKNSISLASVLKPIMEADTAASKARANLPLSVANWAAEYMPSATRDAARAEVERAIPSAEKGYKSRVIAFIINAQHVKPALTLRSRLAAEGVEVTRPEQFVYRAIGFAAKGEDMETAMRKVLAGAAARPLHAKLASIAKMLREVGAEWSAALDMATKCLAESEKLAKAAKAANGNAEAVPPAFDFEAFARTPAGRRQLAAWAEKRKNPKAKAKAKAK